MPDVQFSRVPTNASQLCRRDPETLEQFLRCNPQLTNGSTTTPGHFAYSMSYTGDIASRLVTQQFNSLPLTARQHLDNCVADYGDDVHALAEFYERHIAGFELPAIAQTTNSIAGVGVAAVQGRTTGFQSALIQYQTALVELNRHSRAGSLAGAQKVQLRQNVRVAYDRLNRLYEQEMRSIVSSQNRNRNRGSALSNADRGVTLAERPRGRGIHVADMHEGQKVSRFSEGLRYAGRGLIAVDVGFRGAKVRQAHSNDEDWKRELAVQTGGLVGSVSGGGVTAGTVALTASRVALAATPMGWGILIGSSIAIGAVAAYHADKQGQSWAASVWDRIFGG